MTQVWLLRALVITLASMLGMLVVRACLGSTPVSTLGNIGLSATLTFLMWLGVWIGTLTPRKQ